MQALSSWSRRESWSVEKGVSPSDETQLKLLAAGHDPGLRPSSVSLEQIDAPPTSSGHRIAGKASRSVLYDEQQLKVTHRPAQGVLLDSLRELLTAGSAARRKELVTEKLRGMGFEWLAYGTVRQGRTGFTLLGVLETYAHAGWMQCYLDGAYHEIDPLLREAPRGGLPLVWDFQDLDAHALLQQAGGRGRRFMADLQASGIRSGVLFRAPSLGMTDEEAIISFSSRTSGRDWISDDVLGQALMLGLCMHEFLSRHTRRTCGPTASALISARQQDVLRCSVDGQSNKEIARNLGVSLHAVDYHLRQLRTRFGVQNRTQLVKAAMSRV